VTHQYVAGAPYAGPVTSRSLGGEAVDELAKYMTAGIVTVEFPEVMEALLNIGGEGVR